MVEYYAGLVADYPLVSIEDPLNEEDWEGWKAMTERMGAEVQIVGDDLFVTNVERIQRGIDTEAANSLLVKVNQIGSLSETMDAVNLAHRSGFTTMMSHRSGETEDTTIGTWRWRSAVARSSPAHRPVRTGWPSTTSSCASSRTSMMQLFMQDVQLSRVSRRESVA